MSVKRLVLAAGLCLLVGPARAQITITAGDIPQVIGDSFIYDYLNQTDATVNNGSPGGPHTWTFDTATYVGALYTTSVVNKASTPFAAQFPDANRATMEPRGGGVVLYDYFKIDAGAMLVEGTGNYDNGILKAFIFNPPTTEIRLPATYGNSWQTGYTIRDTFIDTVYAAAFARRCSVDAWGTAVTPAGSFECLRENWVEVITETAYVNGLPILVETIPDRQYVWMAKGQGMVAMTGSIYGDSSPNYTQASQYTVMVHASVAGVAETPGEPARTTPPRQDIARGFLLLPSSQLSSLSLLAIDGRKVRDLGPGANDLRTLAPGVYFLAEPRTRTVSKLVLAP